MESKCQCQWSDAAPISCQCHPWPATQQGVDNSCSSTPYWAHPLPSFLKKEEGTTNSVNLPTSGSHHNIFSRGAPKEPFTLKKEMASWKYPVSACIAPCISSRRLNRTYSEQRTRCLLTTTIAFCLGISVGALLPFVFPSMEVGQSSGLIARDSLQVSLPPPPQKLVEVHSSPSSLNSVSSVERNSSSQFGGSTNASSPSIYSPVTFVDLPPLPVMVKKSLPVVDGIYLSDWVENLLPKGFSDEEVENWQVFASSSSSKVTRVEAGCGRMQNRLVTYENGDQACCRYRQNFDQIQGEIFSFYLSQLLGIKNLAPSTLDVISSSSVKWAGVQEELKSAGWVDDKPVVLTKFVENLSPAFIPQLLRSNTRRVHPPDLPQFNLSPEEVEVPNRFFDDITELAQWSDLIVFDYLTANLDRMVNNLYNLQWNPTMMEAPAHNLAKEPSGLLVFLDNESGLLHGYRLLDKYEHYHRLMLDSICVFRRGTVEAIERLHKYGSVQPLFKSMLSQFASSHLVPMIPDKSIKVLNQRVDSVYRQIQKCQSLYKSKRTSDV